MGANGGARVVRPSSVRPSADEARAALLEREAGVAAALGLLHSRDITFAMASPAPQPNLRCYAERMGWSDVPWHTILSDGASGR